MTRDKLLPLFPESLAETFSQMTNQVSDLDEHLASILAGEAEGAVEVGGVKDDRLEMGGVKDDR